MKNMKNIIVPTIVLTIISTIIAVLLALTYNLTGVGNLGTGLTDEELSEYANIIPNCKKLELVEYTSEEKDLLGIYTNESKENLVLHIKTAGYAGKSKPIEALVGFNSDGSITNVKVIACPETPGLGTKIQDEKYLENYVGVKETANDVDTITSATISSKALRSGVEFALKQFEVVKEAVL